MKKQTSPLVSIVVLNWNGLEDTKKCIESIKQLRYPRVETIIVDNGSVDGSKEYFRTLKDVVFLDLPENTGFTGGHIAGRNVAKGEYIALVNNDLLLDKNWINECMETFMRHKDAAIVGGKAFKWNDTNPSGNTANDFYTYQELDPETGETRTLLVGEEECTVDSISGAALLAKQSCLDSVGYLDDIFFTYYEETDLIARLMRAGFRAYFNPDAHTWHKIGASSSGNSSYYPYMMHRNRYVFAVKNLDEPYLRRFLKNYRNEVRTAYLRRLKNRHDLDAACRIKAYKWIRTHQDVIQQGRKSVQKMGGSYTDKLRAAEHNDVTVVITCYNYEAYVGKAIDSVLNQTVVPKKIIIVNDGSTDGSKKIIDSYRDHPLIEIIHQTNQGVIAAKNLGIERSKTYWTIFLDADDLILPTFIQETLKMSHNGAKDIVYTDMRLFGAINDIFKARAYSVHTLLKTNYINNTTLIKTSILKQVGGYKPAMSHGLEDWELYITLVEAGAKPQYLPLPLMKYRQHDSDISRNSQVIEKEQKLVKQIRNLHRGFYRKHGYYRTILWHGFKLVAYSVRYPGTFIVIVKAVPSGIKKALAHIYGQGLAYVQKKTQ